MLGSWRLAVCQSVSLGQRGVCTENRRVILATRIIRGGEKERIGKTRDIRQPGVFSSRFSIFLSLLQSVGDFRSRIEDRTPSSTIANDGQFHSVECVFDALIYHFSLRFGKSEFWWSVDTLGVFFFFFFFVSLFISSGSVPVTLFFS